MKGVKAKNLTRVNKTCHLYKNTHPLFPQPRPASQTNNSSFNNNQSKTCLLSRGSLFLRTHIFIRNTILFEKVSSREINLFLCLFKNQNPREASSRSRIFLISLVYVFIYICMCVTSPGQTKNKTDLKFGTHTPIDLI